MKTYKLFIQEYNIMKNDYITREEIVKTNDIYHEIGKIYCQSLVRIKRIDYLDITKDLKQEIEKLYDKEEQIIRKLEDLIIVGKQVENEWAVDICKMIIEELKGSDKNE